MSGTSQTRKLEKVLLVGVENKSRNSAEAADSLQELHELAKTSGVVVLDQMTVNVREIAPATYIRSGSMERINQRIKDLGATLVLVDIELSPIQNRNLEKFWCQRVVDRTGLILDIFALHAHSKEGKLQVELAQYQYLYPRLVGAWTHLSKQRGGGVGLRGPGETQLEVDRRRVRERISALKLQIKTVESSRKLHRRPRLALPLPMVTLVGYTNAGKSTLFNQLAKGSQISVDKLFATLDPKTKKIRLKSGHEILLTDTVGFIRHLPHQLIEAFKSTFEEASHSDVLLHVIDASREDREELIGSVNSVLSETGLNEIPQIYVFNKIDQCSLEARIPMGYREVRVSALDGSGLSELVERIESELTRHLQKVDFFIPHKAYANMSLLYQQGRVISKKDEPEGIRGEAYLSEKLMNQLKGYVSFKKVAGF